MPNLGIARYASMGGKAKAARRLGLERVARELGALDTPADAQRWLRQIVLWGAAGLIPGTMANACASCVREWLKAHDVARIEPRIRAIELQLRAVDRGRNG